MAIEGFTRNLTEGGLGRDHENIRALFVALGGNDSTGKADIGLLLRTLPPMLAAIANEKKERMSHAQDPRPATAKVLYTPTHQHTINTLYQSILLTHTHTYPLTHPLIPSHIPSHIPSNAPSPISINPHITVDYVSGRNKTMPSRSIFS